MLSLLRERGSMAARGLIAVGLLCAASVLHASALAPDEVLASAEHARISGDWQRALRLGHEALDAAQGAAKSQSVLRAALLLAELNRLTDQFDEAKTLLAVARDAAASQPADATGALLLLLVQANLELATAMASSSQFTDPSSVPPSASQQLAAARPLFAQALVLAEQVNQSVLAAKAGLGLLAAGEPAVLPRVLSLIEQMPIGIQRNELRLALTERTEGGFDATALLGRVLTDAESLGDVRVMSVALGRLGTAAERRGDVSAAIDLTRRASFLAQGFSDLQVRWYWQLGRLHAHNGALDVGIRAWRLAFESLQQLRTANHAPISRPELNAMLYGFADLLLRRAALDQDGAQRRARLLEARESVERLKAGELRDLFRDDCVTELQARITPIDQLPEGTAAIYPIVLVDRLELLVSLAGALHQVVVPVGRDRLTSTVRELRQLLEKRTTREFLQPAERLHEWLITPIELLLREAGAHTLVFVPDGALRTIPLSALFDGSRFLVERYALATTPGLSLTDARPLNRSGARMFLAGVSKSVQGFAPLNEVPSELQQIRALYGGTQLLDEAFQIQAFGRELEQHPYTIVHVASHAQFDTDPRRTFLLTFDAKIGLDRLSEMMSVSQFRREPIELLTLSACQTASGDERAALGLAGIAIKAGARSALAGLWYVDDRVASRLLVDFYRTLREPGLSKAQALRQAQLRMLADRRFAHPGYWAPYLMIGNWQ